MAGTWFGYKNQEYHIGAGRELKSVPLSPDWRVMLSVRHKQPDNRDSDGDGIVDRKDSCPNQAEDLDQVEDFDGCPEHNPIILEAKDHFANEVEKIAWNMVLKSNENISSLKTEGSKFELEVSEVEMVSSVIKLEEELAVLGSLQLVALDEHEQLIPHATWFIDGETASPPRKIETIVPLLVGEHDIVVRAEGFREYKDRITIEAEEVKIVHLALVQAKVNKHLEIKEKIFFKTGKEEIEERSYELLNEIVGILSRHSEIEVVHIEGYTDNQGAAETNKKLSQDRANAVRSYLIQKGVEPERLVAIGYGEEKPIDSNDTEKGRANNRRVVFSIIEKFGK